MMQRLEWRRAPHVEEFDRQKQVLEYMTKAWPAARELEPRVARPGDLFDLVHRHLQRSEGFDLCLLYFFTALMQDHVYAPMPDGSSKFVNDATWRDGQTDLPRRGAVWAPFAAYLPLLRQRNLPIPQWVLEPTSGTRVILTLLERLGDAGIEMLSALVNRDSSTVRSDGGCAGGRYPHEMAFLHHWVGDCRCTRAWWHIRWMASSAGLRRATTKTPRRCFST